MRRILISAGLLMLMCLMTVVPVFSAEQSSLLRIDRAVFLYGPLFSTYTSDFFMYENEYGSIYEVTIDGTTFDAVPIASTSRDPNPAPFRTQTLYLKTVDQVYEGYPDYVNFSSLSLTSGGQFIVDGVVKDSFITYEDYWQAYTTVQIIPSP